MSSEIVPTVSGAGNTNIAAPKPKSRQDSAALHWFFTFNNHTDEEWYKMALYANSVGKVCVMQEETGKEGTQHIQGYIEFMKRERFTAIKKVWPTAHWEKCKSPKNAIEYCQKEETRTGRQFSKGLPEKINIISTLYPWQEEITKYKASDRAIEWYYDLTGNVGKTALCKYLCVTEGASFFQGGKGTDILHPLTEIFKTDPNSKRLKLIIFNYPRTVEGHISYTAIESIKDGLWFSGKYEGGQVCINPPRVVIFANWRPDTTALSRDRWLIRSISKDTGLGSIEDIIDIPKLSE